MPERLEDVLSSVLAVPVEKLSDDSSSENLQSWDSLRQLSIILAVESAYGISITPTQAMNMNSISAIKAVLAEHGLDTST